MNEHRQSLPLTALSVAAAMVAAPDLGGSNGSTPSGPLGVDEACAGSCKPRLGWYCTTPTGNIYNYCDPSECS